MNRDKAIEIAANTIRDYVIHEGHGEWASAVVARADALLAAMGEQPRACDGAGMNWRCSTIVRYVGDFVVNLDGTKHTCALPDDDANPGPVEYCDETCCAATEARVVAEIAAWVRAIHPKSANCFGDRDRLAEMVERGDWRAKAVR